MLDLFVEVKSNSIDKRSLLSPMIILKHSQFEDRAVTKLKDGSLCIPSAAINWCKLL